MIKTIEKIDEYLRNGGYFNPEMMDHDKVRDLLIQCRDDLEAFARIFRQLNLDKYPDTYFVTGALGKFEKHEMPPKLMVVPSYGVDVTYIYERTGKSTSPEW
jgi:hypothetical protein